MVGNILHSVTALLVVTLLTWVVPATEGFAASECPHILSYKQSSRALEGLIILERPTYTTDYKLTIEYCVPFKTVQDGGQSKITINTDDKYLLRYSHIFPFASPTPAIQKITFNGRVVCQGHKESGPGTSCSSLSHLTYNAPRRECGKARHRYGTSAAAGVERGDWPWVVAIFHQRGLTSLDFSCGGSLVDNLHIVTGARCLMDNHNRRIEPKELFAKVGVHDLVRYFEEHTEIVGISKVKIHPGYRMGNFIDDIAIVTLSRNVSFTPYIQPVCLWGTDDDQTNLSDKIGTVISWGQLANNDGTSSAFAQKRIVPITSCLNPDIAYQQLVYEKTFCAGNSDQPGVCKGDSGGGLYIEEDEHWSLRGIISSPADGICTFGEQIMYTDVAKYKLWIQDNI